MDTLDVLLGRVVPVIGPTAAALFLLVRYYRSDQVYERASEYLSTRVDALEKEVTNLHKENGALRRRVVTLEIQLLQEGIDPNGGSP